MYDVVSLGHNLTTDDSCGFTATGDVLDENGPCSLLSRTTLTDG